jgi:hypothetical protein
MAEYLSISSYIRKPFLNCNCSILNFLISVHPYLEEFPVEGVLFLPLLLFQLHLQLHRQELF